MRRAKRTEEALKKHLKDSSVEELVPESYRLLLKEERMEANLSIQDLSKLSNVPIWEIKLHENGGRLMRKTSFVSCGEALLSKQKL